MVLDDVICSTVATGCLQGRDGRAGGAGLLQRRLRRSGWVLSFFVNDDVAALAALSFSETLIATAVG